MTMRGVKLRMQFMKDFMNAVNTGKRKLKRERRAAERKNNVIKKPARMEHLLANLKVMRPPVKRRTKPDVVKKGKEQRVAAVRNKEF